MWRVHVNDPVKSARPGEGSVQHVKSIGGCNDDDIVSSIEAIHLDQELVEGLVPLVIALTCASLLTNRIKFINENDDRGNSTRLQAELWRSLASSLSSLHNT